MRAVRHYEASVLMSRWGMDYEIGWDEEFVAVARDGGLAAFSQTADGMHKVLMWNAMLRLAGPGQP